MYKQKKISGRHRYLFVVVAFLMISISTACNSYTKEDTESFLKAYQGSPCFEGSEFICVTLENPLNHYAADDPRTIDVTFAVKPAANTDLRKGIFVVATGGPGSSGILSADYYASGYDQAILDHFDIVFFDQRGMGRSGDLTCPEAAAGYYRPDPSPNSDPAENLKRIARVFSEECVQELSNPDILPFLGTAQAVEDLEYFRSLIGDEKIWLYGESYGTQFSQLYAEKNPTHLAGMILDGTVDLSLTGIEYYRQQAEGFNYTFFATFEACKADPLCLQEATSLSLSNVALPGELPISAYDSLLAGLENEPKTYLFPLPNGGVVQREFTFSDLEFVGASQLYGEGDRMLLTRALFKSARDGDIVPLARLLYLNLSLDPQTLTAMQDDSYSDAVYYAVECQDYGYAGNSPDEKADNYLAEGNWIAIARFKSIIYGDLPCAYWPAAISDPARPAPVRAEGIPVLILGATADPVTPLGNGMNVFQHLADGYLITTNGGPHVTFGYGNSCPDKLVVDFLVQGTPPASRTTTCAGRVMDSYVPLAPASASAFASLPEALVSFEIEMYYLPEFYYWQGDESMTAGCPQGGTMQAESTDEGIAITLADCAFSAGFQLTGSGIYDSENDIFTGDTTVSGNWVCDRLQYIRTAETIAVDGSCNGQPTQFQSVWPAYGPWQVWKQQHPLLTITDAAAGP
jgi:pimeloyl-ACP methyl ester carboxylesterase